MPLTLIDAVLETETQLRVNGKRDLIRRWVNWTYRRVCRSYPWTWLEKEATTPSTSTTPNYYTLPPDFSAPLVVRFRSASGEYKALNVHPIEHEDASFANQTDQSDSPDRAIITGRTMLLRPGVNSANGLVILRYLRSPVELLLDTDQALCPDVFRDVLVDGSTAIGSRWLWDDKGDQDRAWQSYLSGLQELIQSDRGGTAYNDSMGLDRGWVDMYHDTGTY
jgi:hypothetical protein